MKGAPDDRTPPARRIDKRIQELGDWDGKMLARLRAVAFNKSRG